VVVRPALEASTSDLPPQRINGLLAELDAILAAKAYSLETYDNYRLHLLRFFKRLGKDPTATTRDDVCDYLLEMLDSGLSVSYHNQAKAALTTLIRDVLNMPDRVNRITSSSSP